MASAQRDEFLVARSLLQGGSRDASSGITEHAMRRFVVTVVPDISSSAAASATAIFGRFARNHPQGNLAVDDLKEYLSSIAPLLEINWADMCHSFVTETFLQTFRLLTEDSPETPGSGASGAHHASATTTSSNQESSNITTVQSARKEDVREFLEGTQCADGRPLSATVVDISKFLSDRGRRNDVYQDDFIALLSMIIRDRPVDPTVLAESITERRKQRREGKKKAMEKIKAAMSNHLEDGMLGAELRAAASPPRRRALSPYAFGSWKLNQGAVHHVSADGEVARPAAVTQLSPVTQANPTYQPVIPIPSPRDRTNAPGQQQQTPTSKGMAPVVMKPLAIPQHQQQQQAGGAGGSTPRNGGGMTNFSFSEIPMINVETTAPAALSTTASTTTSYDFSAHNAILDETFALLDVSEGGSISLDAVYELCAAFPNPPQPNAIRRVFHLVDVNASNDIDREEFEQLCFLLQQKTSLTVTDMCKYYTTAMYRRLFELLDEDGDADASVSREELRVLLEAISPILNATFSSNDVFRLTKEYETDQLNFPQFQNVVKQLIRGRSISKVVGAFEEVLRRRRLLKRQALEKFANASSHHSRSPPPHNTSGKKLPPPPSGPPPAKVCHNCSIQARRIIELEDQLAVVVAQRDQLEKEKKLLHMNKTAAGGTYSSAASSSGGGGAVLRGTALLQWFDALAAPAGISGGDSSQHALPPLQRASQLLTPLAPHVGSELLDAFGVSYSTFFNPTLQLAADPTLCPLSGDRTIWADYVFSPMCSESSRRLRELHAVVSHKLLPLFDAVVTALHPVVYTLQAIVAESDVGSIVAQENIDTLSPQLNGLVAARTLLSKEFDATRQDEHAVRTCLSQFQRSRGDVGAISLLQLTTSSSKVRAKSEPHHSSPGKSPRGHSSNNPAVTTLHSPGSSSALQQTAAAANSSNNTNNATAAHRLSTEFQEATVATASFVQLLCAIATAPLDAEVVANRIITYFDVPITDADVDTISCLYASFAAISKRVNEEHWARAEHSARRTLDHIKEAVCTAVQFAKKDKSVMANLVTSVDDDVGRTPPLTSSFADPSALTRDHMPPLSASTGARAPSPQQQRIGTTPSRPTPRAPSPQQHRALSNTTSAPDKQPMQQRARSTSLSRGANPSGSGEAVGGGAVHPHQHSHEVSMRSSSPRVRSRRERPVNVRQQLDRLLEEFLTTWKNRIPSNFDRTDPATNIFCFGAKKIELSAVDNFIVVKVGGGYLLLVEYCEKYAAMEMRRWNLHLEKTAVASAGGPAYRRSISPGTAGSFGLIYTQSNGVGSATTTTGLRASSASRQASTPRTTTPLRASTTTAQRLLSARSPNA